MIEEDIEENITGIHNHSLTGTKENIWENEEENTSFVVDELDNDSQAFLPAQQKMLEQTEKAERERTGQDSRGENQWL